MASWWAEGVGRRLVGVAWPWSCGRRPQVEMATSVVAREEGEVGIEDVREKGWARRAARGPVPLHVAAQEDEGERDEAGGRSGASPNRDNDGGASE